MDNENTTPKKQDNNDPEQESKRRELALKLTKQWLDDENAKNAALALRESLSTTKRQLADYIEPLAQAAIADLNGNAKTLNFFTPLNEELKETKKALENTLAQIPRYFQELIDELPNFTFGALEKIETLEPYLTAIIKAAAEEQPDKYNDDFSVFLDIICTSFTEEGEPKPDSPYIDLIKQAIDLQENYDTINSMQAIAQQWQELEQAEKAEQLLEIIVKPTNKLGLGLDKLNLSIFDTVRDLKSGQYKIDTLGDSGKNPVLLMLDYADGIDNFDYYDELVQSVSTALHETMGIFSETQVCKVMGLAPTTQNRKNVRKSMDNQLITKVTINNLSEAKKAKNYPKWDNVTDTLMSFRRVDASFNGKRTTGIALKGLPILQEFARGRKQYTEFNPDLLNVPTKNKTRRLIGSTVYFIKRISRIKTGNGNPKILKSTLLKEFNVKNNHKDTFLKNVREILNHFQREKFITSYEESTNFFYINVKKEITAKNKKAIKGKTTAAENYE